MNLARKIHRNRVTSKASRKGTPMRRCRLVNGGWFHTTKGRWTPA